MAKKMKKKSGKRETHTVGPGIWRDTLKNQKTRNAHQRTWNLARKLKNVENEKCSLQELEYVQKSEKRAK